MNNKLKQAGFTLVEVMIAIVIFAVGMLAVTSLQLKNIQGNSFANDMSQAMTLAQNKIEESMTLGFNDLNILDQDGDGTNQDANNDGIDDNGGEFGLYDPFPVPGVFPQTPNLGARPPDYRQVNGAYTVCWNVAVNCSGKNTKTIKVIVYWSKGGKWKSVSLEYVKSLV